MRRDDLLAFINAVYGSTTGQAHGAAGVDGRFVNVNGKHKYDFTKPNWREFHFAHPEQTDDHIDKILDAAPKYDIYLCPYLMYGGNRTPGGTVARDKLHADWDGSPDDLPALIDKVTAINGFAVATGSPGHAQVFVPLAEPVTAPRHRELCEALHRYLPPGSDSKKATNDVFRVPRTFNHKGRALGGESDEVVWLVRPTGARIDNDTLAETIGAATSPATGEGETRCAAAASTHCEVDLTAHPDVRAALDKVTGDRSDDTYRVVAACYDDRLTLEQTRWAVASRTDLAQRLDGRNDDDVLTCWLKVTDNRQQQVQVTGPASGEANTKPDNHIEPQPIAGHQEALDVFKKWLHISDTAPVLAVAATIIANRADGDPVWLLLVGPPSGGKTEILSACSSLNYVVPAATITEAALLSGTSKRDRAKDATGGLLRQIGEFGILLAKDFTSVLSQNKDTAKQAMAAMREVYDGSWDRPVGTDGGKVLHWQGKCGLVGGATPSYDRYGSVVNALGDRFLLLRLPDVDPTKQAGAALKAAQHEKQMRGELAGAMLALIASADLSRVHAALDAGEEKTLVELAEFTARVRTAVERDGYTGELLVMPQPEGPARLVKAMRQLYGALRALGVDEDTRWGVLGRVAVDCAPAIRVPLLRQLLANPDWRRTADIAEDAGLAPKTAARHLDDLALLKLADRVKQNRKPTGDAREVLRPADNSPYLWRATGWLHTHWPKKVGQKTTTNREEELKTPVEDEEPYRPPRSSLSYFCGRCGQQLLAPASVERGICEGCHLHPDEEEDR